MYVIFFCREFYTEKHIQAVKQFLELISTSSNSSGVARQRPTMLQEQPVVLKEGYVHCFVFLIKCNSHLILIKIIIKM